MLEDFEPEDAEQENGTIVIEKNFNFDMLRDERPAINRIKPPDFSDLVYVPVNPKVEPQLVGKTYYSKANPVQSMILAHHWKYYYCGCIQYDNPMPTAERVMNTCTINPIQTQEEIFVLNTYLNKRLGTTSSQRWRRECWLRLKPILQSIWDEYSKVKLESDAEDYFQLHSVMDEDGNRVPEPQKKPGRPSTTATLSLSIEDAVERKRLLVYHSTYRQKYHQMASEGRDPASVAERLDAIYEAVELLGGVPSGWIKYKIGNSNGGNGGNNKNKSG